MNKTERRIILEGIKPEDMVGIELGLWYGYPLCCILNFGKRVDKFHRGELVNTPGEFKLEGGGYIPCPECNKLNDQTLIDNINANRLNPIPFKAPPCPPTPPSTRSVATKRPKSATPSPA